jgi:hypothetical protein
MDGALGNPGLFGDGAHAPVCCSLGLARECFGDQLGHRLVLNRAGPAATHLVVEPLDPIGDEAVAPFADRMGADSKPRRHDGVAGLALARQHDLRSQRQHRRQRARPRYGQKDSRVRRWKSSVPPSGVRLASGNSFDQDTRNQCNNYATNLRDVTLVGAVLLRTIMDISARATA